jgi:hypothetical protein
MESVIIGFGGFVRGLLVSLFQPLTNQKIRDCEGGQVETDCLLKPSRSRGLLRETNVPARVGRFQFVRRGCPDGFPAARKLLLQTCTVL